MKQGARRSWVRRIGPVVLALLAACGLYLHSQYVPPILMYHRIDGRSAESALSVSPESFERQMAFLSHHARAVPLDRIVDRILRDEPPERGAVAITFDDGFTSVYTQAYPVLLKYHLPATIFIVTDWVGTGEYLTWDQIHEMAAHGIDIGAHTLSHPWLPSLKLDHLYREVEDSRRILQEHVPGSARHFSYPFGAYDPTTKHAVRAAGYLSACATNPGRRRSWSDPFALKRLRISRSSDNLFVLWIETSGYYTWLKEHRGKHFWRAKPAEPSGGQES